LTKPTKKTKKIGKTNKKDKSFYYCKLLVLALSQTRSDRFWYFKILDIFTLNLDPKSDILTLKISNQKLEKTKNGQT
jgi:hypothetical protein